VELALAEEDSAVLRVIEARACFIRSVAANVHKRSATVKTDASKQMSKVTNLYRVRVFIDFDRIDLRFRTITDASPLCLKHFVSHLLRHSLGTMNFDVKQK
jgi:hypothetical protein